jgi:uncharacterized protein
MNCPRCGNEMMEVAKHTVVIDTCSSCGGIWLDKGELAKITAQLREAEASVDRELAAVGQPPRQYGGESPGEGDHYRGQDQRHYDHRYPDNHYVNKDHKGYQYRKKSGFERLFDIFD